MASCFDWIPYHALMLTQRFYSLMLQKMKHSSDVGQKFLLLWVDKLTMCNPIYIWDFRDSFANLACCVNVWFILPYSPVDLHLKSICTTNIFLV